MWSAHTISRRILKVNDFLSTDYADFYKINLCNLWIERWSNDREEKGTKVQSAQSGEEE
jgi:hypothetical protein